MQAQVDTGKRQRVEVVEVPSLLDYTAEFVVQDAIDSNIGMVKGLFLKDDAILRQLATDESFVAKLMQHARDPPYNRPVDEHETVCVLRCEEDADCVESVTVFLGDLPGFLSPCIADHITSRFVGEPFIPESKISAEDKVLDLTDTDSLCDFINHSDGNKEARNAVLKFVYFTDASELAYANERAEEEKNNGDKSDAYAFTLFTPTSPSYDPSVRAEKKKKEDEEDEEDEEEEKEEEDEEEEDDEEEEKKEQDEEDEEDEENDEAEEDEKKIMALLRRDPSTLTAKEEELLDEAFGECVDDFAENVVADKETLWHCLTKSGPAKGWHTPSRFMIRVHMSE
tara:strand:- start:213 stop:1232 length:1020 start_codon:yes stop_codon:yes gene_type:complete